jgi:hypothetical protein
MEPQVETPFASPAVPQAVSRGDLLSADCRAAHASDAGSDIAADPRAVAGFERQPPRKARPAAPAGRCPWRRGRR